MFNFFKKRKIYCQECGKDITEKGGFAHDLKIYCDGDCAVNDYLPTRGPEILEFYRRSSKEIQEDIRKNKLIHFSKLEKKF